MCIHWRCTSTQIISKSFLFCFRSRLIPLDFFVFVFISFNVDSTAAVMEGNWCYYKLYVCTWAIISVVIFYLFPAYLKQYQNSMPTMDTYCPNQSTAHEIFFFRFYSTFFIFYSLLLLFSTLFRLNCYSASCCSSQFTAFRNNLPWILQSCRVSITHSSIELAYNRIDLWTKLLSMLFPLPTLYLVFFFHSVCYLSTFVQSPPLLYNEWRSGTSFFSFISISSCCCFSSTSVHFCSLSRCRAMRSDYAFFNNFDYWRGNFLVESELVGVFFILVLLLLIFRRLLAYSTREFIASMWPQLI